MTDIKNYQSFVRVVQGRRYSIASSVLLAHDRFWDGHNLDRRGRNTYLLRTPRGRYFLFVATAWAGERDNFIPLSQAEAEAYYEELPVQEVDWEQAFGYPPEDA